MKRFQPIMTWALTAAFLINFELVTLSQLSSTEQSGSQLNNSPIETNTPGIFTTIEFGEIYRGFQLGLRDVFLETEQSEIDKMSLASPEFEPRIRSLLKQINDRIVIGLANRENWALYSDRLAHLAAMNIAIGNTKDGLFLAERCISILNVLGNEAVREESCSRIISAIDVATRTVPRNDGKKTENQSQIENVLALMIDGALKETVVDSELRPLDLQFQTANLLIRLGSYEAASKSIKNLIDQFAADLESAKLLSDKILVSQISIRLSFLHDYQKNIYMALGERKLAGDSLAESLKLLHQNKKEAWIRFQKGEQDALPNFHRVWEHCIETGLGPKFPGVVPTSQTQLIPVSFMFQAKYSLISLIPMNQLPTTGQELVQELRSTIYLKSDNVEEVIQEILADPDFENLKTVKILEFPLIEYELANGEGKLAWERLQRLEKSWEELGKDAEFQQDFESLIQLFHTEKFNFAMYQNYLCTYFDNDEFRDLANFNRRWKEHQFAFGYSRSIPTHSLDYLKNKIERLRAEQNSVIDKKYHNQPKPTSAIKIK